MQTMGLGYYWGRVIKKLRGKSIMNSNIHHTSKVEAGSQVISVTMGKHSFCGYDCQLINCEIGNFCSISDNVIVGGASHPLDWVSTSPVFYSGRDSVKTKFSNHNYHEDNPTAFTTIGSDVWIGSNAIIKAGVKIGDGAVIGMGSIVTKDVPDYAIVGGNPAQLIRMRFNDTIIADLQSISWWEWDDTKISQFAQYIPDPNEFIQEVLKS
jgi:acetyltransferase-like isoleucine patch superfamily enzyme